MAGDAVRLCAVPARELPARSEVPLRPHRAQARSPLTTSLHPSACSSFLPSTTRTLHDRSPPVPLPPRHGAGHARTEPAVQPGAGAGRRRQHLAGCDRSCRPGRAARRHSRGPGQPAAAAGGHQRHRPPAAGHPRCEPQWGGWCVEPAFDARPGRRPVAHPGRWHGPDRLLPEPHESGALLHRSHTTGFAQGVRRHLAGERRRRQHRRQHPGRDARARICATG